MTFARLVRGVLRTSVLCGALSSPARVLRAATFAEFVDPNPAPDNQFGYQVVPLSTGNVVIVAPNDDAAGTNAGAVYLFNGATGALISTLRGSTAGDRVGDGGVTVLSNGNFVVRSPSWDNGATVNAGAATWGSGTSGVSGVVSAANSLIGSTANDASNGGVLALSNGNYVLRSPSWNNGAMTDAGAVTWGSGTTGVSGVISAANSLIGSTNFEGVGVVTALSNGNYVVGIPQWDNGAVLNAGAATWCNGATGRVGVVSAANSLVGSTAGDGVGNGVTALSNGHYVVRSSNWSNGAISSAGAVTWCNGTTGRVGVVSAANSLVGSTASDNVGADVIALSNGNYVVRSQEWSNGAISSAGAVTWCNGTTGRVGVVSAANSLVGSTASDIVGVGGVTALTNGNYVVSSWAWNNGAVVGAGAVTWCSGTMGRVGVVSVANSLVGSTAQDRAGERSPVALTNGNYVVPIPNWDNGAVANAGAVTWGGTTGVAGVVSAANSLVGSTANDRIGDNSGVTPLSNGNYVIRSPSWDRGAIVDAGAATWGSGTTGVTGTISVANSLVGSVQSDAVGSSLTALTNGNYVVLSRFWDNGGASDAGAVTWGSGTTGVTGTISALNSLVGSMDDDEIGLNVTALANGNYVVISPVWDHGGLVDAGAATWGSGTSGVTGTISVANSLVGSTAGDNVGITPGVTALPNGNYVVANSRWDNGGLADAGAATWSTGATGVTGTVSVANSLIGATANTELLETVVDDVNQTFIAVFFSENGGRVRVGPREFRPMIVSAVDILNDQGGWLRLTFNRVELDAPNLSTPVATYGVWRRVPGTSPASAGKAIPSAVSGERRDAEIPEPLRAAVTAGLDAREAEGRYYVEGPGTQDPAIAAAFPPGIWELVASVPALQQTQYVVAVPTISNAAPNDFVVSAHTTTPSIWFVGDPVSGQSVDNLAPASPAQLTAAYSGGQTNLQWAANSEHDLGSYRIYRGTAADFTPAPGNRIATVVSPGHTDPGPAGRYYKVSAVDVNGNESGFALIGPDATTDVDPDGPVAFALEGARPNPAKGSGLHVAFALPTGAAARLELLDVSGRRVLAREVGTMGAGRHTVNLAAGRNVAPGLYWVRLAQGANRQTMRVAVIE